MTSPDDATKLAQRLEYGWAKIDEANERGHIAMANELTDFWLKLEQQYRAAADEINYANPEQHELIAERNAA